ncbi:DEAD/DEAH box helicase [Ancylomarina sp. YFZ004]
MQYKIINDELFTQQFRADQDFYYYKNCTDKSCTKTLKLEELEDYIIQSDISEENKNTRNLIVINPIKSLDGILGKSKEYFYLPNSIMFDLDVKKEAVDVQNQLLKDTNAKTLDDALKQVYEQLKSDECCLYLDYSQSGTGLKAIFSVVSQTYVDYLDGDDVNTLLAEGIHQQNFKVLLSYLQKYGLKFYDNKSIDYLDGCGNKLTQGTFSSNGTHFYINSMAKVLRGEFDEKLVFNEINKNSNKTYLNSDDKDVLKLNNKYSEAFFKHITEIHNERGDEWMQFEKAIKEVMGHYLYDLYPSLQHLDREYLKSYYKLFKKYYCGNSRKKEKTSLDNFKEYVNKTRYNYVVPLHQIFSKCYGYVPTVDIDTVECDFFKNEYDEIIEYNEFVGKEEQQEELFTIFDKHDNVVFKSDAGSGKTTLIQKYISYKFKDGLSRIAFVIPKNSLLEQQKYIIEELEEFKDIKIVSNYDSKTYKKENFNKDDKVLILSSTPKLRYGADVELVIIDEIQNLVFYSDTIISNRLRGVKTIFTSATPEAYLIGEHDYYYLNMIKEDKVKQTLNIIIRKSQTAALKELINKDRKQMIFLNDVSRSKNFAASFPHINFSYLNRQVKNKKETKEVLRNQYLKDNHYLVTRYVSEGLNFNNEKWDDLIIMEDKSLSPSELYQLSCRFRKVKGLNIYLIARGRNGLSDRELQYDCLQNLIEDDRLNKAENLCVRVNKHHKANSNRSYMKHEYLLKYNGGDYVVNYDKFKLDAYNKYFQQYYMNCSDVFDYSLGYYFTLFKSFIKEDEEHDKFVKDERIENIFIANRDVITSMYSVQKEFTKRNQFDIDEEVSSLFNNEDHSSNPHCISDEDFKVIEDNYSQFVLLCKRYNELIELGGDVDKATSTNSAYKLITKNLSYQNIGSCVNRTELAGLDLELYNRQEKFINMVIQNKLFIKHRNKKSVFACVDADEVMSYLKSNNKMLIELNLGVKDYELTVERRSVDLYLSKMPRYIKKCRKSVCGVSTRVSELINLSERLN